MAITLDDLRTFAAETASPDVSSAAGDREINYWINAAFRRLWTSHSWRHSHRQGRINMLPEETGSAMTLTQGSRVITLTGEVFKAKWLDEQWTLYVDGESRMTFQLGEITSPTSAKLASDELWIQASSSGTSYTFARHIFPLPEGAREITRVEYMQTLTEIAYLPPHRFDRARQDSPTSRNGYPLAWTVRDGNIELWPSSGSEYSTILLTYRKKPPKYSVSDPEETEVDWPEDMEDMLQKAIMLEAATTQGKNSPVPYEIALREYEVLLRHYKDEDNDLPSAAGPMSLGRYPVVTDWSMLYIDDIAP